MGNTSCCNPEPLNLTQQKVIQDDNEGGLRLDFILLITDRVEAKLFTDFKPSAGIDNFVGVNVQNLTALHTYIDQLMEKEKGSAIVNVSEVKKNAHQKNINLECSKLIDQIKSGLFELKKNTNKNIKPLNFNQSLNENNIVDTPHFLPWIQTNHQHVCVYVGQWMYEDQFLMRNFPHGVGRLYINNEVWEGQIHLSLLKLQSEKGTVQKIRQTLQSKSKTLGTKIQLLKKYLSLQLNGQGRKFTKDDEYSGQFQNGILNGKGQYKNFKHDYSYEGIWVDNLKHGKGIEKTRSSKYEGEWKNDKKNGQGTLKFYLNGQQEKQRAKDQQTINQMMENKTDYKNKKNIVAADMKMEQELDKVVRETLKNNLHKYRGGEVLAFQKPKDSPFEMQGFPFFTKEFIENIKLEQLLKANLCQKYVGQFVDDAFHGKGMYHWFKGNFYIGDWVDGKMEGLGKFYWREGYVYYGEYKNDLKHGKGEMMWNPYKRHRGNWAFGKKHGYGEEIKIILDPENGFYLVIKAGLWKDNDLKKQDIYFQRTLTLEIPSDITKLLKRHYYQVYPEARPKENKQLMIQQEANRYIKNSCSWCGNYILKEKKQQGFLEALLDNAENKQNEDIGQEMCNDCSNKIKETLNPQ